MANCKSINPLLCLETLFFLLIDMNQKGQKRRRISPASSHLSGSFNILPKLPAELRCYEFGNNQITSC
ncbi:hypothetical protein BACPEC_01822 [[Bacteroides] pectinophilus ATCC 43243]|uniref:Uncharacterized protein n=1 Tax=[Bacteroides] pectinophilus ATCC 43243 TaxID=483218 RepID=B7ARW8_9FIRM|nr:hypothetical protein BACPEC_01822 [[Bacteroides] pectinophilus ATCC 43243]